MSTMKTFVSSAGAVLMLISLAGNAQESTDRQAEQPHSMNRMSMKMMHDCMSHCQAMSGSMQELRSTVEEARESNDPEQMRAALEQVTEHMPEMQGKMGGCMQMKKQGKDGPMEHDRDQSEPHRP